MSMYLKTFWGKIIFISWLSQFMHGIRPSIDGKISITFTWFTIISFHSSKSWSLVLARQYYLLKLQPFSLVKDFMKLPRNLLLLGSSKVKKIIFFYHFMYQIKFLMRKCADSIKPRPISPLRGEKKIHTPSMENWRIYCKSHNPH